MTRIVIPDGGTIGSASDTDAISIASSGKPTFSAGIANTGTIDAGTLGLNVSHTVGWQHLKSFHHTSSSSATNIIEFDNVLRSDYTAYVLHIGWLNSSLAHPLDLHFRYRSGGASGVDHADVTYVGVNTEYSIANASGDNYYNTIHITAVNKATLINAAYSHDNDYYGVMGHIYIYNSNSPTLLGTSTQRSSANLSPHLRGTLLHYHSGNSNTNEQWGKTENYWYFYTGHSSSDYTGCKMWMTKWDDHDTSANLRAGSYMSLYGLKSQATA